MNNDAIGVFDSGIGGLTAVKELNKILPNENIIYFGDTARIPYGTRSRETIMQYAKQDIAFLKSFDIKMIIGACGTVSSIVGNKNVTGDIPFTGVLYPTAQTACSVTSNNKIGVIGTSATIHSGSYAKALKTIKPNVSVYGNACPLFVHLVENGFTNRDNEVTRLVAQQYLEPIRSEGVDTLILGCTHYPIIKDIISDIMGSDVKLISPGEEAVKYTLNRLTANNMLNESETQGKNKFYVSDSIKLFEENATTFLGHAIEGEVFKVDIHNFPDCQE